MALAGCVGRLLELEEAEGGELRGSEQDLNSKESRLRAGEPPQVGVNPLRLHLQSQTYKSVDRLETLYPKRHCLAAKSSCKPFPAHHSPGKRAHSRSTLLPVQEPAVDSLACVCEH
eukprot:3192250-Rhodomonas_salina.2